MKICTNLPATDLAVASQALILCGPWLVPRISKPMGLSTLSITRSVSKLFPLRALPRKVMRRYMEHPAMQQLGTALLGHDLQPERWIFIVGCYNSGTSLLQKVLGRHPQIGVLPTEGIFLTQSLPYPEQFGWVRMWCECLDQVRLSTGAEHRELAARIKRNWSVWYEGKPANLVEKSISNTARMPFLQAHFQPAYFIHLVRNGYAVAEGIQRKAVPREWGNPRYSEQYPIGQCARQWQANYELVQQDRPELERFLEIRYETFVETPDLVLGQVAEFLQIDPFADSVADGVWHVHEKQSPITNMNARSIARLSKQDVADIEDAAAGALDFYGYKASAD